MSNTAYIGSGTTLSSKYYLRSFYRSNREAGTSSKRREFSGNQLALADGRALRQAVRRLTSSDFSDDQDANTRNSVLAYIQTYNNMLSSAGRGKHVVVGLDIGEHAVARVGVLVIRKIRGSQPAYCLTKRPAVCESELVATEFTAFGGSPGFPVGTVETA